MRTERKLADMRPLAAAGLAAAMLGAGVGSATGQEAPGRAAEVDPMPPLQTPRGPLAFERDFFVYAASRGRNPFNPPTESATAVQPTGLVLLGIVRATDPSGATDPSRATDPTRAVVLLAATGGGAGHSATGGGARTFRLRLGEQVGSLRVVEVGAGRAVVAVREPGQRERFAELALPRRTPSRATPNKAAGDGS